jgi:dihydrofolate synthase/folylpolyglutamate synthase
VNKLNPIRTIEQAEAALLPYVPLVAQLTGKDTTLERIIPLMALLGNPQEQLRVVHIAGTSGKTSTAYFTAALLHTAGNKVGLTVSPHVDSITERVQFDGQPISIPIFCSELEQFLEIIKVLKRPPSYFELMYAFAIWEFSRANVDYAVIETGMGGLYDATNVTTRADKVCVITDIGFDHMKILGNTLPEIAAQKIGIVHDHNQVIMYEQSEPIMSVIRDWTRDHNAPLLLTSEEAERQLSRGDISGMAAYQQRNWLLAYRVFRYVAKRDGLKPLSLRKLSLTQSLQVPGRMDAWQVGHKTVVMDGAHNAQKMAAFVSSFRVLYPDKKPAFLLAFKQGKEYQDVVKLLAPLASFIVVTTFAYSQDLPVGSTDPNEVAAAFKAAGNTNVQVVHDRAAAFTALLQETDDIAVVTGSFYLLSQIRNDISKL